MVKVKVGDKVKISDKSEWYHSADVINPINQTGVVTAVFTDEYLPVEVLWDNNITNVYNHKDLILLNRGFNYEN